MAKTPTPAERDILSDILRYLATRDDGRWWRSNTGAATDGRRVIRFGVVGQADISGVMAGTGRRCELEIKSPTGRQSPAQARFADMIRDMGGVYILARCVDDVRAGLDAASREATRC